MLVKNRKVVKKQSFKRYRGSRKSELYFTLAIGAVFMAGLSLSYLETRDRAGLGASLGAKFYAVANATSDNLSK